MRAPGWSRLFRDYVDRSSPPKHVVSEQELLALVLTDGRRINEDWQTIIAHAMRYLGFKLRAHDRVYVRRATEAGAS